MLIPLKYSNPKVGFTIDFWPKIHQTHIFEYNRSYQIQLSVISIGDTEYWAL